MSTAPFRTLMRLLTAAFLLLLGSATDGRPHVSVQRHDSSDRAIAASNHGVLLPTTPERKGVDTAPPLLASEASLHDARVQSAPAPTRDFSSLCSCEQTTGQAARPPPFQA